MSLVASLRSRGLPCPLRAPFVGLDPSAAPRRSPRLRAFLSTTSTTLSSSTPPKPYYVTTPIFYVNADPHVGHLYSIVVSDVLARFARLRRPERQVVFSTGTDEHGLKIQRAAEAQARDPKEFCDAISVRFKHLAEAGNSSHTHFIRTTDAHHRAAVHHLWNVLLEKGFIYKGSHSGWYAVSDEAFYPENQIQKVKDEKTGAEYMAAIESGQRVEWTDEENYKFRLSAFREPLIKWLQSNPSAIYPPNRHTAVLNSLLSSESAASDLSISRPSSRLSWGIPVPDDPEHTIYVWVDALTNYIATAGYPDAIPSWPADVQVVGKDIIRFHTIYWPAMLMAAGIELPKTVLAHAHWTMRKLKMSKSRGNVADPFAAMEMYGVDVLRYYLMRVGGSFFEDSDYAPSEILRYHKHELAGALGNLVNRISGKKLLKRLGSSTPAPPASGPAEADRTLDGVLRDLPARVDAHMAGFEIGRALDAIMESVFEANRHFTHLEPWSASASADDVARAVFYSAETLRIAGILLQPFMPTKANELLDRLNVPAERRTWADAQVGSGGEGVITLGGAGKAWKEPLFPALAVTEEGSEEAVAVQA